MITFGALLFSTCTNTALHFDMEVEKKKKKACTEALLI